MTKIFSVEVWDRKKRRYYTVHQGSNQERAMIMARKPYIARDGKNLVRIIEERIETIVIYRSDE